VIFIKYLTAPGNVSGTAQVPWWLRYWGSNRVRRGIRPGAFRSWPETGFEQIGARAALL